MVRARIWETDREFAESGKKDRQMAQCVQETEYRNKEQILPELKHVINKLVEEGLEEYLFSTAFVDLHVDQHDTFFEATVTLGTECYLWPFDHRRVALSLRDKLLFGLLKWDLRPVVEIALRQNSWWYV